VNDRPRSRSVHGLTSKVLGEVPGSIRAAEPGPGGVANGTRSAWHRRRWLRRLAAGVASRCSSQQVRRLPAELVLPEKYGRGCRIGAVVFVVGVRPPTKGGAKGKESRS
jgi:hypothetical protein